MEQTKFLCDFSEETWHQTYKYHTDGTVSDSHLRVASDLASVEKDPDGWTEKFYDALRDFKFVPGGRITSNAGTDLHGTTYINCFTAGAQVLTSNGLRPIEDIEIGDLVLTHKGRWMPVVNVMDRDYSGPAIRFSSPHMQRDLVSTPEHPFYAGGEDWAPASKAQSIVLSIGDVEGQAPVIDITDWLPEIIKKDVVINDRKIYIQKQVRGGQGAIRVQKCDPVNRYFTLTKSAAYALGRYVGDGSCWQQFKKSSYPKSGFNIIFNEYEHEELNTVKQTLEKMFGLQLNINRSGTDPNNKNWFYIRKSSSIVSTAFSEMCGDSVYTKFIPAFMWSAPTSIQESFVLGVFDADGTVAERGELKIALANEKLIDQLQAMCNLIGLPLAKRRERHQYDGSSPTFILSCGDNSTNYFVRSRLKKFYKDNRLTRVAEKGPGRFKSPVDKIGSNWCSNNLIRADITVNTTVYNLSIQEDESYTVNNVVVHNCFVDGPVVEDKDSILGIFNALTRAAQTLKSEGGYGFCCDFIRPRGSFIHGVGVETPGAVQMLSLWDVMSAVITKGSDQKKKKKEGKNKIRKGAMMVTMSCWHPDIEEFVEAKSVSGVFTKFNMSVLCTDKFMEAVRKNKDWDLVYPDTTHTDYKAKWDGNVKAWVEEGRPVVVLKTLKAADLWNKIMQATYSRNEPGVLFVDRINYFNNLWYEEWISATNPCGEQLLSVGAVCLLGSFNLTQFVNKSRTNWDYEKLEKYIPIAVRMLDNVNDKTKVPLPEQEWNLKHKRRIGIGYLGYGSALYMMKVKYGSAKALKLTDQLAKFFTNTAYRASAELAKEKGAFLLYDEKKYLQSKFIAQALDKDTIELIKKYGIRNSHLTSIQPTGNSSVYANNVSSGLEPVVAPSYIRTAIVPLPPDGLVVPKVNWGAKSFAEKPHNDWRWIKEGDEDLLAIEFDGTIYKVDRNRGLTKETTVQDYGMRFLSEVGEWDADADWAANIFNLTIDEHIDTMKVFAKYVDAAMSKTINVPNEYPYEDFKTLYFDMYDSGVIKGGTTYRHGTMTSVISADKTVLTDGRPAEIVATHAPKRPESLPCEIHQVSVKGNKWIILVGMLAGKPYEMFAGEAEQLTLTTKARAGVLVRIKSGHYNLHVGEGEDELIVKNVVRVFGDEATAWATRMVSMSLRHGVEVGFIVEQLSKDGNIADANKVMARVLKRYIPEGSKSKGLCPECETDGLVYQEGCVLCKNCGYSRCM